MVGLILSYGCSVMLIKLYTNIVIHIFHSYTCNMKKIVLLLFSFPETYFPISEHLDGLISRPVNMKRA